MLAETTAKGEISKIKAAREKMKSARNIGDPMPIEYHRLFGALLALKWIIGGNTNCKPSVILTED